MSRQKTAHPDTQPSEIRGPEAGTQTRSRRIGRPRKRLSARVIEQLARAQLTNEEIARICNCSADTLTRRFAERLKAWKSVGVGSARRELYRQGMSRSGAGKTSALIFFLKNPQRVRPLQHRERERSTGGHAAHASVSNHERTAGKAAKRARDHDDGRGVPLTGT